MFCSTQQSGVVVVAVAVVENVEARDPISRWLRRFFKKDCPRSSPFLLWFKFFFFVFFSPQRISPQCAERFEFPAENQIAKSSASSAHMPRTLFFFFTGCPHTCTSLIFTHCTRFQLVTYDRASLNHFMPPHTQ